MASYWVRIFFIAVLLINNPFATFTEYSKEANLSLPSHSADQISLSHLSPNSPTIDKSPNLPNLSSLLDESPCEVFSHILSYLPDRDNATVRLAHSSFHSPLSLAKSTQLTRLSYILNNWIKKEDYSKVYIIKFHLLEAAELKKNPDFQGFQPFKKQIQKIPPYMLSKLETILFYLRFRNNAILSKVLNYIIDSSSKNTAPIDGLQEYKKKCQSTQLRLDQAYSKLNNEEFADLIFLEGLTFIEEEFKKARAERQSTMKTQALP